MTEIGAVDGRVLYQSKASSIRATVEEAVKAGVSLRGAYLRDAYLRDAYLRDADLRGAYLRGAYLRDADLRDADLRGADLRGADLRGAYLRGAYLRGAYLRGANLEDADLRGADLRDAKGCNPHMTTDLLILREQPGNIRAYKLVRKDGRGPFNGGITYEVGGSYEVAEADTSDEPCGAGINLATLPWCCREWHPGFRILIAEFTAEDIASIPAGSDGKFRVRRCRIVGERDLTELGLTS